MRIQLGLVLGGRVLISGGVVGGSLMMTSGGNLDFSFLLMAITFGKVSLWLKLAAKTLMLASFQGWVGPYHVNILSMGSYPSPVFLIKSIPNMAGSVRFRMTTKGCR